MGTSSYCVICGDTIDGRCSLGRGKNFSICKNPVCIQTYKSKRIISSATLVDRNVDYNAFIAQRKLDTYNGFCGRCGKPLTLNFRYSNLRHNTTARCEAAPTVRKIKVPVEVIKDLRNIMQKNRVKRPPRQKPRTYLNPCKDPDSIIRDTEFLEQFMRKKIGK